MLVTLAALKLTFGLLVVASLERIWLGTAAPADVNVVLNFVSLAILVAGLMLAPRAFRAKKVEGELKEKDRIIDGHKQLAELKEAEAEAAKEKQAELGNMLDEARSEAAAWQARYQEQSQYTAAPALEAIRDLMVENSAESERRHKETLLVLRSLRALIPGDRDGAAEGV